METAVSSVGLRSIPLTKGFSALVDEADYELLSAHSWRALVRTNNVYAVRWERGSEIPPGGVRRMIYMHRGVLGLKPDDEAHVDHVNRDGLDNRRANLRTCSRGENLANAPAKGGRSRFKGLYFRKDTGRWVARLGADGRVRFLGSFESEVDAAMAYDQAALEQWGEFALLNFPAEGHLAKEVV